jgi:hypothetical protein
MREKVHVEIDESLTESVDLVETFNQSIAFKEKEDHNHEQ